MPADDRMMNRQKPSIRLPHPSGLTRIVFRFPVLLYRLNLGWLFGDRALLLEHVGRKSGIVRKAVVEVVDHDIQKETYTIASAWGTQSNWYRNIGEHPSVNFVVGTSRFPAVAKKLSADEAAQHLDLYASKHPLAFRQFGLIMFGIRNQDTVQIIRTLTEVVPFVELIPPRG
jgi:deazaflavin-dependent oxidoreductase (nitroreductase family)